MCQLTVSPPVRLLPDWGSTDWDTTRSTSKCAHPRRLDLKTIHQWIDFLQLINLRGDFSTKHSWFSLLTCDELLIGCCVNKLREVCVWVNFVLCENIIFHNFLFIDRIIHRLNPEMSLTALSLSGQKELKLLGGNKQTCNCHTCNCGRWFNYRK